MEIDRPCADRAAPGQRHLCPAIARHQRPQHQNGSPHLAHEIVGRARLGDLPSRQLEHAPVMPAVRGMAVEMDRHTELGQQIGHGGDVGHMRQITQPQGLIGQQAGRHQGKSRILGPADRYLALEAAAAADSNPVHMAPQPARIAQPGTCPGIALRRLAPSVERGRPCGFYLMETAASSMAGRFSPERSRPFRGLKPPAVPVAAACGG